ncbi:hypothetical protein P153DRAFT_395101 [Dothidotthia symphoricarpi CBS 119687]|uniref:Uncharacterized protein n=1 Tax=Dothidotthia symphoricarpi CBS 119687 TaxID=1392245 RepID=A0A6A6ALN6_9PLEO|nr:uncharacterized protein P153DRAFT_395101 [Dothidotthia symphoricarpi CBS 119687]KAF2131797.1 hypothetical protein P153DRAFT_395101 [Dothidotthia symphoricarpi CBS 119687]
MSFAFILTLLALAIGAMAAPLNDGFSSAKIPKITTFADDLSLDVAHLNNTDIVGAGTGATRFECGEYKFDDGTIQTFYSQVWAGYPRDQMFCRPFKYERFHKKSGQEGKMVAAKIDLGCTCFFYTVPCDPSHYAEAWKGWDGWMNYASTDKHFKGWWCREEY